MSLKRPRAGFLPLIAVSLLTLTGCEKREVRAYSAPKDTTPSRPSRAPAAPSAPETVSWSLPEGWEEIPGEGIRFATLIVEAGAEDGSRPPLEMRVTPLGLAARDPLANVNRWRVQIGLEPITADQLADVARPMEIDGRQTHLVKLLGAPGEQDSPHEILAAIVPGDQSVWFFMILDHEDRVAKYEGAFEEFMKSVRIQTAQIPESGQLPEGHPPVASGSDAPDTGAAHDPGHALDTAGGLRWTTPEGWHAHAGNSSFRIVSFHVGGDPSDAEVTITRFAGGAGALLPNINRWRGQLGLPSVADVSEQALESIEVGDIEAQLLDLADTSATDSQRARMLVVLFSHGEFVWFVKMTGPYGVLQMQRPTFEAFARGLRFETEQS